MTDFTSFGILIYRYFFKARYEQWYFSSETELHEDPEYDTSSEPWNSAAAGMDLLAIYCLLKLGIYLG